MVDSYIHNTATHPHKDMSLHEQTSIKWLSNCDCAIVKLIYEYVFPMPVHITVHDSIPGFLAACRVCTPSHEMNQVSRDSGHDQQRKTVCGTLTNARKQMSNLPKHCPRRNAGRKSHQGLADCLTEAASPDFVPR